MRTSILAALVASTLAMPLSAATLVQDDPDWTVFLFHGVGDPILDGVTEDPYFTFTVVGSGLLRITDAVNVGDRFQLTINGVLQAQTSVPGVGPGSNADGDLAYNSGYLSRGAYYLAAGDYTVTGIATVSPFEAGNAFIKLTTAAVPEPGTWAMMFAGFGLAGTAMRRRQRLSVVLA